MAESVLEGTYESKPPQEESFLDKVDTALGLQLATKPGVEFGTPEVGSYSGQTNPSPISIEHQTELKRNPSGKSRPGFFGAGGSL